MKNTTKIVKIAMDTDSVLVVDANGTVGELLADARAALREHYVSHGTLPVIGEVIVTLEDGKSYVLTLEPKLVRFPS